MIIGPYKQRVTTYSSNNSLVAIPPDLRDQFGAKPGDFVYVVYDTEKNCLTLYRIESQ